MPSGITRFWLVVSTQLTHPQSYSKSPKCNWLVVEPPTQLKKMQTSKWVKIFPKFRGENNHCLKPPPSWVLQNTFLGGGGGGVPESSVKNSHLQKDTQLTNDFSQTMPLNGRWMIGSKLVKKTGWKNNKGRNI